MNAHSFSYPASSAQRQPPVNLAPGDEACFAREQSRSFPRITARLLRNACVSSEGICTVGNRLVQLPVLLTPDMPLTVRQCVKSTVTLARRALSGLRGGRSEHVRRALLLTDVHFDGFFHWFGDILPKLEALVSSCGDVREYVVLVPATRDAPYVAESLAAYGVEHRVIAPGNFVIADELCFIPRLTPTGNYRPELMRGMRERICGRYPSSGVGRRLYVARAEAPKRRLLNENELAPILASHGFDSVCMEKLRFSEQVKLASRSQMIAGLHGAGLRGGIYPGDSWYHGDAKQLLFLAGVRSRSPLLLRSRPTTLCVAAVVSFGLRRRCGATRCCAGPVGHRRSLSDRGIACYRQGVQVRNSIGPSL